MRGRPIDGVLWRGKAMSSASGTSTISEAGGAASPVQRPFNLLRWFSIFSFAAQVIVGIAIALFLTRYLTAHMLTRDAEVSRDFIESILTTEKGHDYLARRQPGEPASDLDPFIEHLPTLPDVLRINVYGVDRTVIWSSDKQLVGKRFDDNDELEQALRGKITIESGAIAADQNKPEHVGLVTEATERDSDRFVEEYLPIRDEAGKNVIAVIELYKAPRALFRSIDEGVRFVWISVTIGSLLLYLAFFWIVRRADVLMRAQRERLVEAETLSALGEMAAAIAHGIRNPLASIRSAAEVAREEDRDAADECLQDIMNQADRLDGWVRELLAASRGSAPMTEEVDLNRLIRESLDCAAGDLRRQGIELTLQEGSLPPIRGSRAPLAHAFSSIITNAIEAMPQGGRLRVESRSTEKGSIEIAVEDTGAGMPARVARRAFRPLFTTKPNGVGLGLSLARRIVERHAGRIDLDSIAGRGTRVVLTLPTAA